MDKQDIPRTSETFSCFFPVTTSPQVQPFSWLQQEKECFHCTLRDWHHTTYIYIYFLVWPFCSQYYTRGIHQYFYMHL